MADKVVDIAVQRRDETRAPLTSIRAPLDQTFIRHPHKDTAVKPSNSNLGGNRPPSWVEVEVSVSQEGESRALRGLLWCLSRRGRR